VEDPLVKVLQLGAGVDAQFLAQRAPHGAKPLQCLGLPAVPVARQQQLPPAPLAQRVAGDHDLQLSDQVVMVAQRQLGVDQVLTGGLAALGDQPLGHARVHHVDRRLQPAPRRVGEDLHPSAALRARRSPRT
jgi:hypothetical protein